MTAESERLFLAVALSDDVRHALAAFVDDPRELPGRPVDPGNWHVTLRFLGRTEPMQRDIVLAHIDQELAQRRFTLGFGGLGAFPRPGRATVLWLGIEQGADEIEALADRCESAAQAAGFSPEDRPFHPHVTLSRIRPWQDVRPLVERFPRFPATQTVEAITLFRSILGQGGAGYETVDTVPLPV
jgi:2'-5' RNA ligase